MEIAKSVTAYYLCKVSYSYCFNDYIIVAKNNLVQNRQKSSWRAQMPVWKPIVGGRDEMKPLVPGEAQDTRAVASISWRNRPSLIQGQRFQFWNFQL